jgi:hypothetical protein
MTEINCLRCRHCKLLPETDMKDRRAIIFCGKGGHRREINLIGCPLADSRPMIQNQVYTGGDKPRSATDAEKEFLKAHYPVAPWPYLLAITQRSDKMTVVHIANRLGLKRGDSPQRRREAAARIRASRMQRSEIFNEEQARYIEQCYASGLWPQKHFGRKQQKSESEAIRAEIVARVAELDKNGRVWSWESIRSHMKWKAPAYLRDTPERNRRRRQRRRLTNPETGNKETGCQQQ